MLLALRGLHVSILWLKVTCFQVVCLVLRASPPHPLAESDSSPALRRLRLRLRQEPPAPSSFGNSAVVMERACFRASAGKIRSQFTLRQSRTETYRDARTRVANVTGNCGYSVLCPILTNILQM